MTISEFITACDAGPLTDTPTVQDRPLLQALALDRAGNWDAAHSIAQEDPSIMGSAVHAYLHREEGVQWNAEYWYRRAGRPPFTGALDEEWKVLATEILSE